MSEDKAKRKFWEWVRAYANKRIKSEHMHSRKCERCLLWTSEVGGAKSITDSADLCTQKMECNWCGHVSIWDMTSMMPFLIYDPAFKESTP